MANQSFSSSAAHCAQHSSHTVPRLLVVVVAVPFCLVAVVAVVFALANQSSLSATTSSAQKRKKKTVEISIKNLIISIVDKLLGINLAARRQQRLLLAPGPNGIIRVS